MKHTSAVSLDHVGPVEQAHLVWFVGMVGPVEFLRVCDALAMTAAGLPVSSPRGAQRGRL